MEIYGKRILEEISATLGSVSEISAENVLNRIMSAKRVFIAGGGRTGFIVRSFAMRLMHLGIKTHVVGEPTTPGIDLGDLLIIGSGSGETGSLVSMGKKAKTLGAELIVITATPESTIANLSDCCITIPAQTKHSDSTTTVQPMGSLFEQTLLIVLDEMILRLIERKRIDPAAMREMHANLE